MDYARLDYAKRYSAPINKKPRKPSPFSKEPHQWKALGLAGLLSILGVTIWVTNPFGSSAPIHLASVEEVQPLDDQSSDSFDIAQSDSIIDSVIPEEISPILAANMATTQFYGPPQEFQILPKGKISEVTVKKGDTLAIIFERMGFSPNTLHRILDQDLAGAELQKIYPGQQLTFITEGGELKQIRYPHSANETFVINTSPDDISVDLVALPREVRKNYATAVIEDSLYVSAQNAGIDTNIVMDLAEIFAYDIDFFLDVQEGDNFKVMYEEYYVDGEKVGNGPILAAEFVNQDKTYKVVRYTDKDGRSEYYSPDGMSLRKTFLRSPVEYARISSHFNLKRRHPILHQIRAHKGVDYAAPRGTPIRASGDGKIVSLGRNAGYGNRIEIQHGSRYRTLYAHMNGFAKNLKVGSTVEQGQVIGYVGSTGLASGPHLHYEFKVDGVHKDPVKLDLPIIADPLPAKEKKTFMLHASNMLDELNYFDQILLAQQSPTVKAREHG